MKSINFQLYNGSFPSNKMAISPTDYQWQLKNLDSAQENKECNTQTNNYNAHANKDNTHTNKLNAHAKTIYFPQNKINVKIFKFILKTFILETYKGIFFIMNFSFSIVTVQHNSSCFYFTKYPKPTDSSNFYFFQFEKISRFCKQ